MNMAAVRDIIEALVKLDVTLDGLLARIQDALSRGLVDEARAQLAFVDALRAAGGRAANASGEGREA